jgi:adenylate cyclase
MLNAYFNAIVPIVEKEGGVIDKYMGDGLMVLFGAPVSCPDHALRALRASVGMTRAVRALRDEWRKLDVHGVWGEAGLRIGIGVHTGIVVLGAIGSKRRLDYTVIGDAVNVAFRIEGKNKDQETEILISKATHDEIPPRLTVEMGCEANPRKVDLKGLNQPVLVYAVLVA